MQVAGSYSEFRLRSDAAWAEMGGAISVTKDDVLPAGIIADPLTGASFDPYVEPPGAQSCGRGINSEGKATDLIKNLFDLPESLGQTFTRQEILDKVATFEDKAPGKNKVDDALKGLSDSDTPFLETGKDGKKKTYKKHKDVQETC